MSSRASSHHHGVSLIEIAASLVIVAILLGTLIPALSTARRISQREQCASNLQYLGEAWLSYLEANDGEFPFIVDQPSWRWGGVRMSKTSRQNASLDFNRPITRHLYTGGLSYSAVDIFRCPADRGIRNTIGDDPAPVQTTFETFGTSYQANPMLLNATLAGVETEPRALRRAEILTPPAAQVMLGDPTWFETYYNTGRTADWHGAPGECNLLFLDGSVRYRTVRKRGQSSPVVIEPILSTTARTTSGNQDPKK